MTVKSGMERQRLSSNVNTDPNADFLLIENLAGVNAEFEVREKE